jgi:hypothetical protein
LTTPYLADNSSIMLTLTDDDDAYSTFIELTPFKTSRDDTETIKEDGMDAAGKAKRAKKKKKKKKKTQIVDSKYPGIPGFTPRNRWEEFIWLLALSERQW